MRTPIETEARHRRREAHRDAGDAASRDRPLTVGEFRDGIDLLLKALGAIQGIMPPQSYSYGGTSITLDDVERARRRVAAR